MEFITLPLAGFLIGLLIISLGGGGGGIYVGILTAFFNVPPAVAAATSLATIIPTTIIGTLSHWKAGNVNPYLGRIMLLGAVIGALVGSSCSDLLPISLYNKLTGLLLLALGVQMLLSERNSRRKPDHANNPDDSLTAPRDKCSIAKAIAYGFLGGVMSGIVGISGTAPVVAGLALLGCRPLEIVGTSVFVLVGISITGFLVHLGLGNIHWTFVGLLISGTMIGAFLGPVLLKRIKRAVLEQVLPPILIALTLAMGAIVFLK